MALSREIRRKIAQLVWEDKINGIDRWKDIRERKNQANPDVFPNLNREERSETPASTANTATGNRSVGNSVGKKQNPS